MKDKTIAAILALFLGGLGVHKFYLGKNMPGILYFIFCWTLIPALLAFIDAIRLFMMDEKEFALKYNQGYSAHGVSAADELSKLHELKEKGAISDAEFEEKKRQLL